MRVISALATNTRRGSPRSKGPATSEIQWLRGRFRIFEHEHHFEPIEHGTIMRDVVEFASPLGPVGRLVDRFVPRPYLKRLLRRRNEEIKREAERR